eukprot:gene9597-19949_t
MNLEHLNITSIWNEVVHFNEQLEGAQFFSMGILEFFGALYYCMIYRKKVSCSKSWLECLISCAVLQFGGKFLVGLILGQTPSWMLVLKGPLALLSAYLLTFFCPFDIYWNLFCKGFFYKYYYFILSLVCAIEYGHYITSAGMDKAISNSFHLNPNKLKDSVLTNILCGTLCPYGGYLLADWLGIFRTPSFTITSTPGIFSLENKRATSGLVRSFCLAVLYYCLINPSGYLPWKLTLSKEDCHVIIILLQLLHAVLIAISPVLDMYGHLAEACAIVIHPVDNSTQTTVVDQKITKTPGNEVVQSVEKTNKKKKSSSKKNKEE